MRQQRSKWKKKAVEIINIIIIVIDILCDILMYFIIKNMQSSDNHMYRK